MMEDGQELSFARRRKLIDRGYQFRSIATWLAVVLAGFLVCAACLALYFWIASSRGEGMTGAEIERLLAIMLPPILVNDIAIMVLVVVVGIVSTHRVAGPVYRMESDIDRVLSGQLHARVRLRRGDAFPGLAEKVNELIERLDDARRD
jgi:methyl-accepting chemotaxis protein